MHEKATWGLREAEVTGLTEAAVASMRKSTWQAVSTDLLIKSSCATVGLQSCVVSGFLDRVSEKTPLPDELASLLSWRIQNLGHQ